MFKVFFSGTSGTAISVLLVKKCLYRVSVSEAFSSTEEVWGEWNLNRPSPLNAFFTSVNWFSTNVFNSPTRVVGLTLCVLVLSGS